MGTRATWIFGGIVMLAGACDEGASGANLDECEVSLRNSQNNGTWLNGTWLNGTWLNGTWLNGFDLSGADLGGPSGGSDNIRVTSQTETEVEFPDFWLVGSNVHIMKGNGNIKSGTDVNNVKVDFDVSEGGQFKKKKLKISNPTRQSPSSDVWFYDVEYKVESGPWNPLCVSDNGSTTQAILIGGVWNPVTGERRQTGSDGVTVACRGAALAKCVEWGYRPWVSASMKDYHQACTRLVRADYCGEGTPHTLANTPIHVLDQIGVQNVDPDVTYVPEAEWGPNGATCLNSANTRLANQNLNCTLPACGTAFGSGGILQSGKVLSGP